LHQHFLLILPVVQRHGQVYFRHLDAEAKEEAIAEMVALAWKWFLRLVDQEKDASDFPRAIATYAAKAFNSGRRLCGQQKAKDVLSRRAQRLHEFSVESLSGSLQVPHEKLYSEVGGQRQLDGFEDRLRDNTHTPPDEQAAFRIDFPAWRLTHSLRNRDLIDDLMRGERTMDLADKYGISPARVSQLRREFMEDWLRFTGETVA
jgi:hypothetical protein